MTEVETYEHFRALGIPPQEAAILVLAEAVNNVGIHIKWLGRGDQYGPGAIEALAMAVAGEGLHGSVKEALQDVASAVGSLAEAVHDKE